jgi:hypothetical protein
LWAQLLAGDYYLRAIHEQDFRSFLASAARGLNVSDDKWQMDAVPDFHAVYYMGNVTQAHNTRTRATTQPPTHPQTHAT